MIDSDDEMPMSLERSRDYICEGSKKESDKENAIQKPKKRTYTIREKIKIA